MTMKTKSKKCLHCQKVEDTYLSTKELLDEYRSRNHSISEELANVRKLWNLNVESLRRDAEADELMLAKQRERLIRLTEIVNGAKLLLAHTGGLSKTRGTTDELDGTKWVKLHGVFKLITAEADLNKKIAALEVDTEIPPKGKP
jgi:hypothetical protein